MWRIILCLHRIFVKVKLVFQKVMTLVHVGGSGGKSELHLWIHRNANAFDVLKKTHSNNFVFTTWTHNTVEHLGHKCLWHATFGLANGRAKSSKPLMRSR